MRIAFLASGLEPGRDGVGDYTRFFAGECARAGHECVMVALNDRHGASITEEELAGAGGRIPILRLPAGVPWEERTGRAKEFLARFDPEWVSVQFVCYGFHPKGLVRGLAALLREVIGERKIQIMFHELWIGLGKGGRLKDKVIGLAQRVLIRGLVRSLAPRVVHASNPAYVALLARNGIPAGLLPLFGNTPLHDGGGAGWLDREVSAAGLDNRGAFWVFGFFGSLHPVWPPEPIFSHLREASQRHGRKIVIVSIGRLGGGESLWDSLAARYAGWFTFVRLGERSAEQVSDFLQWIDFGIGTTPWAIIGKSGTVAAMLDHGVPVIVNRDDARFGFEVPPPASPLLVKMGPDLADRLPGLKRSAPDPSLPGIARTFLTDLERAG